MPDITPGSQAGKPITLETPGAQPKPKRGPGRPPGAPNKAPSASGTAADVKQAIATLDSLYGVLGTGLMLAGLPESAVKFAEVSEDLSKSNAEALAASPKLAKWIANTGQTGGAATFFITHVIAFGSVGMIAQKELAAKRAANPKPEPRPRSAENMDTFTEPAAPTNDPTWIPNL